MIRREFRKAEITFEPVISCHHNYVSEGRYEGADLLITRKGAIRAGSGGCGIIPGSMGHRIVHRPRPRQHGCLQLRVPRRGPPHEPRRGAAKRADTTRGLAQQTRGVECRKGASVVDEISGAYKSVERVIDQQRDLVEVVAKLKQVICVEG